MVAFIVLSSFFSFQRELSFVNLHLVYSRAIMEEVDRLKLQLAAALAEIEVLKLQLNNANYLYKAELIESGKLPKLRETAATGEEQQN
jgi:hypothetical protein